VTRRTTRMFLVFMTCLALLNLGGATSSNSELYSLPAYAKTPENKLSNTHILKSVSPGQEISASPGQEVFMDLQYQLWAPDNPNEIDQLFFIASWTPSWPPPSGYYVPIYNGIPGLYPGVTRITEVRLRAPSAAGVFYLWFCMCAHYSMGQAVNEYKRPLTMPAHIRLVVGVVPDVTVTVYQTRTITLTQTVWSGRTVYAPTQTATKYLTGTVTITSYSPTITVTIKGSSPSYPTLLGILGTLVLFESVLYRREKHHQD